MSNKNVFGKSAVILAALFAGVILSGCTEGDSEVSDIAESAAGAASSVYSESGSLFYDSGSPSTAVSSSKSSSSQSAAESSFQSSSSSQPAEESSVQSSVQSNENSQPQPVIVDPASFISEDEAREAALEELNVREYQVKFTRTELGYDKDTAVYYIEFSANTLLYQYKVNALDGTAKPNGVDLISNAARTPESLLISEEAAIKVALKQHKYSESEVDNIEVEQYYDGARAMYSVYLHADGIIWGTNLDAVTGSVSSISQATLM